MKTAFKAYRGHVYHVVHETKTGAARKTAWTLCGQNFESGERSTHQPTCADCRKLDNPLLLSGQDVQFLQTVIDLGKWRDAPRSESFQQLVRRDYLDKNVILTRRGMVLAQDWIQGPVPLQHRDGLTHSRKPLDKYPTCKSNGRFIDADTMTLSRYEKLRKIEESIVVTCLACLG